MLLSNIAPIYPSSFRGITKRTMEMALASMRTLVRFLHETMAEEMVLYLLVVDKTERYGNSI
jgi:hypothetical protein